MNRRSSIPKNPNSKGENRINNLSSQEVDFRSNDDNSIPSLAEFKSDYVIKSAGDQKSTNFTREIRKGNVDLNRKNTIKIPKIIMQTWKTKDIPRHWRSRVSIQALMPDWKYYLMTDEDNLNFVKTYFPDFVSHFQMFEYPIQRADAIRYMWLYVNGGVYLDLDLELMKPLDDLFYEDKDLYVVRSANVTNIYTNAFMGAKPKLRVMLQCLEFMTLPYKLWHVGKHLKVVNSTGPNMFTRAISSVKDIAKLEGREDFEVKELPAHLIVACSVCDPKPCSTEGGYCKTLGGSSWSGTDTAFITRVYCNRFYILTVLVIFIALIVFILFLKIRRAIVVGRQIRMVRRKKR